MLYDIENFRINRILYLTKNKLDIDICPICFYEFSNIEKVTLICGHVLCINCENNNLLDKKKCHMCRYNFRKM